jgi:serine/threonine-protein kinase
MGIVYRARHTLLGRTVALKLVAARDGASCQRRFEGEALALARLNHPNVVTLYDYGHAAGSAYLVMESLEGADLERLVARAGQQDPRRVVHLLLQACNGLAAAHAAGLVHRDVKPANLFLCRGSDGADVLKLLDFGLAKQLDRGDAERSSATLLLGTPGNMAPECFTRPAEVGSPADIYGLGTVAYWLLAGKPVFDGRSLPELAAQHLYEAPAPLPERAPYGVSAELEAIVLSCLEKSPERRPASARALAEALLGCPEAGRWQSEDADVCWQAGKLAAALPNHYHGDTEIMSASPELWSSIRLDGVPSFRECA